MIFDETDGDFDTLSVILSDGENEEVDIWN